MSVTREQRHTRERPCPVCGGHDRLPRGKSVRCNGYESGEYIYCQQVESPYPGPNDTYRHYLAGDCDCGVSHTPGQAAPSRNGRRPAAKDGANRRIVTIYDYRDETGALLFQTVRYCPKDFKYRRPDGKGGWIWNLDGVRRVLYRLPELLAADPAALVFIPEGEKDADRLRSLGLVATSNPMGAGTWRSEYNQDLAGRHVVILPDNDSDGRRHKEQVAGEVHSTAASIRVLELPGLPERGDISDWLDAGHTVEKLRELVGAVPVWSPGEPEPTVVGSQLLEQVEAYVQRYLVLPLQGGYPVLALWAAHTHAVDAAESTPRLAFLSPEPESGKTRALEVLENLVPRPMLPTSATPAAIFRAVSDLPNRPTILFDEIDTVFGPKAKENEELRGLLNAGHRRSGQAYRCVGEGTRQRVQAFPAYAPCGLAGIGDLPDTFMSRSIVFAMRRRAPNERIQPFRRREAEALGHPLREHLAHWMASINRQLEDARPVMPEGVTDRAADVWEPLLAIADAAGGEWPARARAACVECLAAKRDREPSLGLRLLADLRDLFGESEALPTDDILKRLQALEEAPWGDLRGKPLDARRLARMLGKYAAKPAVIRLGAITLRGYRRGDLADAWGRYLPPALPPAREAQQAQQAQQTSEPERETRPGDVADTADVADASATPTTIRNGNRAHVADVADVADFRQGEGEAYEPTEEDDLALVRSGFANPRRLEPDDPLLSGPPMMGEAYDAATGQNVPAPEPAWVRGEPEEPPPGYSDELAEPAEGEL